GAPGRPGPAPPGGGPTAAGDASQALATSSARRGVDGVTVALPHVGGDVQINGNAGNVRALRQRLGLSQEKFAAEIGVSFSTVSRWENAHRKPSPLSWRAVQELARRLGLGEGVLQAPDPADAE